MIHSTAHTGVHIMIKFEMTNILKYYLIQKVSQLSFCHARKKNERQFWHLPYRLKWYLFSLVYPHNTSTSGYVLQRLIIYIGTHL
jgi:hypothetical protein